MKKIITITFILLIGIMFLGGCASTDVEYSNEQQNTNGEPQQNQQQDDAGGIQPPPALPED